MYISPQDYIGKITNTKFPFYDVKNKKVRYKARPVLIIGCEFNHFPCDFTVLPVSKISDKSKRNEKYDYELRQEDCNLLNLKSVPSFIRCHKISTVHSFDVDRNIICDTKKVNPKIFVVAFDKFEKFSKELF